MIRRNIVVGSSSLLFSLPDQCPMCKASISPVVLHTISNATLCSSNVAGFSMALSCPSCQQLFVTKFKDKDLNGHYTVCAIAPNLPKDKEFDPILSEISSSFINIYNQALAAETYSLDQIAGMGYRKALEFLIKDYAKLLDPSNSPDIESLLLSRCIQKYIDHPKIKATATASVWIGNDETHYIRKFENKDIQDLKRFIDSCVYWILADYDATSAAELVSK